MNSNEFPWGKVVKVHTIGTHTITEYIVGEAWSNAGSTEFHTEGASNESLDSALLFSLCVKAGDSGAVWYVEKLLGGLK